MFKFPKDMLLICFNINYNLITPKDDKIFENCYKKMFDLFDNIEISYCDVCLKFLKCQVKRLNMLFFLFYSYFNLE